MKHLVWLIALIGFTPTAHSQSFEPFHQNIKKKKYRHCTSERVYVSIEGLLPGEPHKNGAWVFNEQGLVVSYEKYNDKGVLDIKGVNKYDKEGNILLTEEDNMHINEHEKIIYEYDEKGRLATKKDFRDQKLIVTYQHYYGDDMLCDSTIWLDKNDKPELIEYYEYNDKGWKVEQREKTDTGRADGKTIFEYHEDGTLKDEILYDGFGNVFERMYYNDEGLLIKREISYIDYEVLYEYTYNKKGVMESYKRTQSNQPQYELISFSWSKKIP